MSIQEERILVGKVVFDEFFLENKLPLMGSLMDGVTGKYHKNHFSPFEEKVKGKVFVERILQKNLSFHSVNSFCSGRHHFLVTSVNFPRNQIIGGYIEAVLISWMNGTVAGLN